jgi:DNA modification methylase
MNKSVLNKVHCTDCVEFCNSAPSGFVNLTVTSPPYNVGISYNEYGDTLGYDQYVAWLDSVWEALYKVQADSSYVAINVGRNTEFNTPAHVAAGLEKAGFKFYKAVQWVKPVGAASQVFWFKMPYPRYYEPYLVTEDILIYYKGEVKGANRGPKVECLDPQFISDVSTNVWYICPDSSKVQKGIHPAPFPIDIPARLIQLLSLPGDVVYDPFAGSGTTLLAASFLDRNYVGTELDQEYCKYARDSLKGKSVFKPVLSKAEMDKPKKNSRSTKTAKKKQTGLF